MKTKLVRAIDSQQAVVGIVGLGYVGLPLMLRFVKSKFDAIGFDIDSFKTDSLNRGESYIDHINGDHVREASKTGRQSATTDFKRIREVDALILCVPTPLGAQRA